MGWQDRPYSGPPPRRSFNWSQLVFGSVSLGEWFGIHVRVHSSLIILAIFRILFPGGLSYQDAVVSMAILFTIILLHEFGHCFAARHVGGEAREILMWPLGGLAFARAPQRPWPAFFTVAGGPLVNVLICIVTGIILVALGRGSFSLPLNPLVFFDGRISMNPESWSLVLSNKLVYYVWWTFLASWTNLFFNLLPIFPLDGGQMLQAILWRPLGYYKSMELSTTLGMAGAVLTGLWGLVSGATMLLVLAFAGFMTCQRMQQALRAGGPSAMWEEPDYSPPRHRQPRITRRPARPKDDRFTWRDLNPLERIARRRRKKRFERLMKDD